MVGFSLVDGWKWVFMPSSIDYLKWAYAFYCNIRTSDHDRSSDLFLQEFTDKEMWLHVTAISHEMKQQCRLQKPTPQH